MRKLIMWNIITLDAYFEGNAPWELPFHELVWGPELKRRSIEQLEAADYLLFGRATYEGMAAHWTTAEGKIAELMNSIPKLVASRTLNSVDWNNSILIKGDLAAEIRKLKEEGGKDIYLFGSAKLAESLLADDLFDEYRIGIAPVILGQGRPLFSQNVNRRELKLVESQTLSNGGMVLTYHNNPLSP